VNSVISGGKITFSRHYSNIPPFCHCHKKVEPKRSRRG